MTLTFKNIAKAIRKRNYIILDHAAERSLYHRLNLIPLIKAIPAHTQRVIMETKDGKLRLNINVLFHGSVYGIVWGLDGNNFIVITAFPYVPVNKFAYDPKDDLSSISDSLNRAA
jgi:hypothetical protein